MSLFNFGKKSKLGIDIGTASIKIVELEDSGRFELKNYGLFELSSSQDEAINFSKSAVDKSKQPIQLADREIVWGIKETLKRSKISTREVVASIQSFSTFSTIITLPYLSEDEIAKAIPFEAQKYIPLPLSEVAMDWSIINTVDPAMSVAESRLGSKNNPMVEILLVAVPNDEALRYQNIMKESGLVLKALELENAALIRAIVGNDLSPLAIVNIGGRSTSVLIVDKGVERQSHNYEVGGFEITKSIARSLGVSLKRAEELKRSAGLAKLDGNAIRQVMSSLADLIVFETKKTIHSYEDAKKIKLARIFLVGGLANMPGFFEYFRDKIGSETALGNPTSRIVIAPALEPLRKELNSTFSVALGLAMRKL